MVDFYSKKNAYQGYKVLFGKAAFIIFISCLSIAASAATLYSRKSGNWSDNNATTGTWSTIDFSGAACGCTPTNADSVIVGNGYTVTQDVNGAAAKSLYIASSSTLSISGNNLPMTIGTGAAPTGGGLTVDGTFSYASGNKDITLGGFYIKGTGTYSQSAGNALKLSRDITISPGTAITFSGSDELNANGKTITNLGTVTFSGTFNLKSSGSWVNSTNSTLNYNIDAALPDIITASASGNTVQINLPASNTTSRDLPASTTTYYNLIVNANGTGSVNLNATTAVTNLTITNGTLDASANAKDMTVSGAWVNNGTFTPGTRTVTFSGTTSVSGTNTTTFYNFTISSGTFTAPSGTMEVQRAFTNNGTYTANSGTISFNGTTSIAGSSTTTFNNVSVCGGTLTESGNRTVNVTGNWTTCSGASYSQSGTGVTVFNGSAAQQIYGSTTFNKLTLSNSAGLTINSDVTVNNTLELNNNIISTGTNKIIIATSSGSVSRTGGTSTGGFIKGYLQLPVTATGARTLTFPLGFYNTNTSAYQYSSFVFALSNATNTTGGIIAGTFYGNSPDIAASLVDPNKSVKQYWTVTNSSVTFTGNNTATFNYLTSQAQGTASSYNVSIYNGATWSVVGTNPTTRTTTQTVQGSFSSFGDFQIGENYNPDNLYNAAQGAINFSDNTKWIRHRTGVLTSSTSSTAVTITSGAAGEIAVGNVLLLQSGTSSCPVIGTISSCSFNAGTNTWTVTLTANATTAATNASYGIRATGTSTDNVYVGNPNLSTAGATNATVDANTTVFSLTMSSQSISNQITMGSGKTLTVNQNVTINQPTGAVSNLFYVNAETVTIGGNLVIGSNTATAGRIAEVYITSGTLNIGTNLIFYTATAANAKLTNNAAPGTGIVNLSGDLVLNSAGTLSSGTGYFNYNSSTTAQTVTLGSSIVYSNLYINNTSGSGATLSAAITSTNVTSKLYVQTGTLHSGGYAIGGAAGTSLDVAAGAVIEFTGAATSTFSGFGTVTLNATSTIQYHNTASLTVPFFFAGSYGNLELAPLANDISFSFSNTTYTIAGNLVIGNGINTNSSGSPTVRATNNTATISIGGDLTINTNARLDCNVRNMDISIKGNWTDNGYFDSGARTVTFNGTANSQTITAASGETFTALVINNTYGTAPQISLGSNVSVTSSATFTAGKVYLNSYNFIIASGATVSAAAIGSSTTSYAVTNSTGGFVQNALASGAAAGKQLFPVGTTSGYSPLSMTNTGTSDNFTVVVSDGVLLNGTSGAAVTSSVVNRTWDISEAVVGGSNSTIKLQWAGAGDELTSFARASSKVYHYYSSLWNDMGGTISGTGPYVLTTTVATTSFSPYIAASSTSVLPITLVNFDAVPYENMVNLFWSTASEENNDYFTIERSVDLDSFEEVSRVSGAGTSKHLLNYSTIDPQPYRGISYYRLKQTDFDGKYTYSKAVAVKFDEQKKLSFNVFPNPSDGSSIQLVGTPDLNKEILVVLYDALGNLVYSKVVLFATGSANLAIDAENRLSPGVYFVVGSSHDQIYKQKLIIR